MTKAIRWRSSNPSAVIRGVSGPVRSLLVAMAVLLLPATSLAANMLKDVRVGKHADFTRVVFELSEAAGYQVEKNNPAPGIAEIVISFDASGRVGAVAVPAGSLIEGMRLLSDGQRSVAHIRLAADGLRIKEITLREPPRIVIDIVDDRVAAAPAVPAVAKKDSAVAPVAVEETVVVEETVEVVETAEVEETGAIEPGEETKPESAAPVDRTAAMPSEPTAPPDGVEPVVPIASSPHTSLPSASDPQPEAASGEGWFTMPNLALAAAGVAVVIFASFVLGRRSEDDEEFGSEDTEDFGGDNPFSGLESPAGAVPAETVVATEEVDPMQSDSDRDGLFDEAPVVLVEEEATDSSEEPVIGFAPADDSTDDFGGTAPTLPEPEIVPTVVAEASAAAPDPAAGQLVRELATRVGELETRLEDAVDAKDRLERQLAAQTEELRVQRAAIARTQRAVRNLSQAAEEKPTEPTPREPGVGS